MLDEEDALCCCRLGDDDVRRLWADNPLITLETPLDGAGLVPRAGFECIWTPDADVEVVLGSITIAAADILREEVGTVCWPGVFIPGVVVGPLVARRVELEPETRRII